MDRDRKNQLHTPRIQSVRTTRRRSVRRRRSNPQTSHTKISNIFIERTATAKTNSTPTESNPYGPPDDDRYEGDDQTLKRLTRRFPTYLSKGPRPQKPTPHPQNPIRTDHQTTIGTKETIKPSNVSHEDFQHIYRKDQTLKRITRRFPTSMT